MKRKIGEIYNKPIVEGDKNLVTKNEVHKSELIDVPTEGGGSKASIYEILSYMRYYEDGSDSHTVMVPFANTKTQESWDEYGVGISANFIDRTHVEIIGLPNKDNSSGHFFCEEYISAYIPEVDKEVEVATGQSMSAIPYLQGDTIVWGTDNRGPLSGYEFTFTFK